jgi:two-component system cell cycle sensor histidine kinase/response regulator CckA
MNAMRRRSIFFELRAALCFVILALLAFHSQQLSPLLWLLGTSYLVSNLLIRILPVAWFENPAAAYAVFFLDIAGLTIVLYSLAGIGSDTLLLFYLTIFMATLGEDLPKSLAIAFGASAVYVWLHLSQGDDVLVEPGTLLRIPFFLVTALLCGFLAQEVRRHKRHIQSLQDIQKTLATQVDISSKGLARSEDLRAAAQELARRFRNLVEDLNAIVWEMDVPTFQITFVSHEAERILGYPVQKWLIEKDFWMNHIHPEDRERIVEFSRKAVAEGKDYNLQYRGLAANGRVVWLQDIVRLVRDASGVVRQLRGVMVDITEYKQLEEQFQQAQKMEAVGRLAGGVAHDFNNLLTVITGYAQLLSGRLGAVEPLSQYVDEIQKAGGRAAALTRRLLAFSRKQAIAPQVLDLNAAVANMEKILRRLIGEDIELETVQRPDLGMVKADPAQIEQVIMNLAVNSRDAMPQGGKLIIETANVELDGAYAGSHVAVSPGPYVMLAVSDTGVGMDAETRARIFEPFFTTKERGRGTGLGLATVYGIVKQSAGNIWVYSERGRGTTFKIYLPRAEEVVVAAHVFAAQATPPRGSETILLVEDEDGVRSLVRRVLQESGYTVLEASRPNEALTTCQQYEGLIHLLFTDVVMPQMSGRELAEKLSSLRPETKTLYMSGYTDEAILHHGVLDPGMPFLQKPFTTEAIAHKVRQVLDASPVVPA